MKKAELKTQWKFEFIKNNISTTLTNCKLISRPTLQIEEIIHQDGSTTLGENHKWLPIALSFSAEDQHDFFISEVYIKNPFKLNLFLYDFDNKLIESWEIEDAVFDHVIVDYINKDKDLQCEISYSKLKYFNPEYMN